MQKRGREAERDREQAAEHAAEYDRRWLHGSCPENRRICALGPCLL